MALKRLGLDAEAGAAYARLRRRMQRPRDGADVIALMAEVVVVMDG